MNNLPSITAGLTIAGLLVSCAATPVIQENPVSTQLAPMEMPTGVSRVVFKLDKLKGKEKRIELNRSQSDGSITALASGGCTWVYTDEVVGPGVSWDNCGSDPTWNAGKNINVTKKGSVWPLEVGNKAVYTYNQVNALGKKQPKTSMVCEVVGAFNIDVAIGNLDAYKVQCVRKKGSWSKTRVWYFSPEHNTVVKAYSRNTSDGMRWDEELLRTEEI